MYPGADDNASGTAALLEIARVLASNPHGLKRTLVLVFWTGEEEGHLGSEYYMLHPVWPLERTSAYLNLDMIGHAWKLDEIRTLVADTKLERGEAFLAGVKAADFIELGVPDTAPELDPVLKQAARAAGLALHLDRTDGRHGGSDYRAFARKGRPFVRFFGNFFDGYHEPTDTRGRRRAGTGAQDDSRGTDNGLAAGRSPGGNMVRTLRFGFGVAVLAAWASAGLAAQAPPPVVVVRAAHLVDVQAGVVLDGQDVLIEGHVIKAVGPRL